METKNRSTKRTTKLTVQILEILLISILMTAIMSGGVLYIKHGAGPGFYNLWWDEFLLACCIAVPAGYLIVPLVGLSTRRFKQ